MKRLFLILLATGFACHGSSAMSPDASPAKESSAGFFPESSSVRSAFSSESNVNTGKISSGNLLGNWVFGGTFGMSFTDGYSSVNITPQVGYAFNRFFTLGVGIGYNYYKNKDYDYKLNYLGAHIYGRFFPIRYIHLYAQPEIQRRWGSVRGEDTGKDIIPSLLLGGGVSIPAGARSSLNVTVYYDVLQERYSPYGNSVGYSVGYSFRF